MSTMANVAAIEQAAAKPVSVVHLARLAKTPLRQQLLGGETEGVSYFHQRYNGALQATEHNTLKVAGKKLLKQILKATSITRRR